MDEHKLQEECRRLVGNEVRCCLSPLVSTLIRAYGSGHARGELEALTEQALELASPVDDYEEAARQEGWEHGTQWWRAAESDDDPGVVRSAEDSEPIIVADTAQEACEIDDIEPYQGEIYEHWAVSDWLADKLLAHGEKVDKDFASLCVWGRPTTGQAIAMDDVIRKIVEDIHAR